MKKFIINCTIKNELQTLTVIFKQSSITYFCVYKNNKWIGTVYRNCDGQYSLMSYSRFRISQMDIRAIGEQIDLQEELHHFNAALSKTLRAA